MAWVRIKLASVGCLRLATLAVAAVLLVTVFCGCRGPLIPPAINSAGPQIRVLLTGSPKPSVELSTTSGYAIYLDGRAIEQKQTSMPRRLITRDGQIWRVGSISAPGRQLTVVPVPASLVRLGEKYYRGSFELIPTADGRFNVVNHVNTDAYIAGVLARELYADWSEATYRALAVAARTYGLHRRAMRRGEFYDVMSGQADQVYGGYLAETKRSRKAASSTMGWVLAAGQAGDEKIFLTQYSACNGGYVNPAAILRDAPDIEPLAGGQIDPDGRSCPRFAWATVTVSKERIYKAVCDQYSKASEIGGLSSIKVAKQTSFGRALWLDLVGPAGKSIRLRAEDLRIALLRAKLPEAKGLYSMNCKIRDMGDSIAFAGGRGFGHGVGLSQWGAQDKAKRGWAAEQILRFYYPGAKIFRAY